MFHNYVSCFYYLLDFQVNFGIETMVLSCMSFSTVAFSTPLSTDLLAPGTVTALLSQGLAKDKNLFARQMKQVISAAVTTAAVTLLTLWDSPGRQV